MGGNQSTQDILNQTINNVAINVMSENSTDISSLISTSNVIDLSNNVGDATITNILQSNTSKINISSLAQLNTNATLQAELISKLSSAVEQKVPTLAVDSNTTQKIQNIIQNNVKQNMSIKNLTKISAGIKTDNLLKDSNRVGNLTFGNIKQSNEAHAAIDLVGKMSTSIIANIKADSTLDSKALQEPASIMPGFGSIFILVIIFILLGGGYFLYSNETLALQTLTNPAVIALIAAILGFFAYESISGQKK